MKTNVPASLPLLEVSDLCVGFAGVDSVARAVEGVSFTLPRGSTLALLGESGCGKSVSALSLLRLIPSPPSVILGGRAIFTPEIGGTGVDLLRLNEKAMNKVRGAGIGVVFQEPMTSLNPVLRVGDQVAESLIAHGAYNKKTALAETARLFAAAGLPEPEKRCRDFPHQLSGGMRQRVMIAMALALKPKLLIADEPTTALDASLQGQILNLMRDLTHAYASSLLLITHDLDIAAAYADYAAVMYCGRIVESGPADAVLQTPLHPYTKGLLASRPRLPGFAGREAKAETWAARRKERLKAIPGSVPPIWERPEGCAFSTRCPQVFAACSGMPDLKTVAKAPERACRCHMVE